MMRPRDFWIATFFTLAVAAAAQAQTLWDRREPSSAYLFHDFRARRVGDIITVLIEENTGSQGQEKREMDKATNHNMLFNGKGNSAANGVGKNFAYDFDLGGSSKRKFDGKVTNQIDRKFTDRMSVTVVGELPNGNLVIEGFRTRVIASEARTLRLVGLVRAADIGPYNTISSQFIANMQVFYEGRGPESSYTNQGWGGRIVNKLWPF